MVKLRRGQRQRKFLNISGWHIRYLHAHPRAWHAIKYLDPRESGAVIPILHANGFKISERTIFGCMDDKEIVSLFSGYGYQVLIVENLDSIDDELQNGLEWAVSEIKKIQQAARSGEPIAKPRWPMLVLRTPKARLLPMSADDWTLRD